MLKNLTPSNQPDKEPEYEDELYDEDVLQLFDPETGISSDHDHLNSYLVRRTDFPSEDEYLEDIASLMDPSLEFENEHIDPDLILDEENFDDAYGPEDYDA